ncbi:hypothetical protein QE152_g38484 [Popillia japonica]|uniref:Uncharacterized protein n=1 Tax=Popillia japonica TaxID=7064 RepID=A0AAW1HXW1_POPJA
MKTSEINTWGDFMQKLIETFIIDEGTTSKWKKMVDRVQKRDVRIACYFHEWVKLCADLKQNVIESKKQVLVDKFMKGQLWDVPLLGERTFFLNKTDKFMKGQLWDVPLLGERTFFLNKSRSKWICAGLSTDFNFEPVIKIAGIKKQCVAFNEEEWERFLSESMNLNKYFEYCRGIFPVCNIDDLRLTSECFDGITRILKIDKAGECVYLSYEGLQELWRLKGVILTRLALLKSLKFPEFYKNMIEYLSETDGDLNNEVEKMLNGVVSECACLASELSVFSFQKMHKDIANIRKGF